MLPAGLDIIAIIVHSLFLLGFAWSSECWLCFALTSKLQMDHRGVCTVFSSNLVCC
ncbi:hypothetical protein SHVI106290_06360 [Shewanella violacea]